MLVDWSIKFRLMFWKFEVSKDVSRENLDCLFLGNFGFGLSIGVIRKIYWIGSFEFGQARCPTWL